MPRCMTLYIFKALYQRPFCYGVKHVSQGFQDICHFISLTCGSFLESPEKPFVKLRAAYSVKLVFSYVVKGIKIKITAKFRASRRLSFEDTKRIMLPEMRPKSLGTFEKQAPEVLVHPIDIFLITSHELLL